MKTRLFLVSALVLALATAACGGEKKPAESPESTAGITETSAQEDMPPPPAKEGDAPAAPAAEGEATGAAGGVIKLGAMKITPVKKGSKDKPIELKADGTVSVDGKPAATIKADSVDSSGGTSMVTVGVDGSLVGNGVNAGYKFEGDELVHENGTKLSVDDEGTISLTRDGKTEPLAKAEGGASAKRAALIATVLWLTVPAPAKVTTAKPKK